MTSDSTEPAGSTESTGSCDHSEYTAEDIIEDRNGVPTNVGVKYSCSKCPHTDTVKYR